MTKRQTNSRRVKADLGEEKAIKPKFKEEREERINKNPLRPRNETQKAYQEAIESKPIVIATGYPGSGKSFVPATIACDRYSLGLINKIYLVRPAVSKSKSLGFFAGTLEEKSSIWLGEIISIFKERLGRETLEIALKHKDIEFIPLEVVKGRSLKDCFVLVDEAEDITIEEARKLVTRVGENCTMVLSGDIGQSDLGSESGLRFLRNLVNKYPDLAEITGIVDFNSPTDIIRSKACRLWTISFVKEGIGKY